MDEYPEDCPTRMAWGLGSGFLAGSLLGAISSNWSDVPMVIRNKTWPAFVRTGSVMLSSGTTLGLVGLTFSTVDVSTLFASSILCSVWESPIHVKSSPYAVLF